MCVGQAFHNLTPKASTYIAETVLPTLLDKTSSVDLNTRQGAVLAIAEILHGLAIVAEQSDRTIQDVVGKLLLLSLGVASCCASIQLGFLMTPSIATKSQYVNSPFYFFPLTTCFWPLQAIFR
jgi:hypothetical protein